MKLGLAISTQNRYETFKKCYDEWLKYLPDDCELVVVDDASDVPVPEATFRFDTMQGVAKVKNKCLELLADKGVIEYFLVDDDCFPLKENWHLPYVNHPEPHLMAIFTAYGNQKAIVRETYRDEQTVAYASVRGYFLYYNKICLDMVGGFDPAFGRYWGEHTNLTDRIHNAGLTTHRAMDVPNSGELIHSMDQHCEVDGTVSDAEYRILSARNRRLKRMNAHKSNYIEFRSTK